jgi:hypothetical protein
MILTDPKNQNEESYFKFLADMDKEELIKIIFRLDIQLHKQDKVIETAIKQKIDGLRHQLIK